MRIMMVSDTYFPKIDGVVISVANAVTELSKKNHSVLLIVPNAIDYKTQSQRNVTIYFFKSFSFLLYPGFRIGAPNLFSMMKLIKGFEPDIIHIHTPGTLGITAMAAAKKLKKPVINTYHTSIPDMMVYLSPVKILGLDRFFIATNMILDGKKNPSWVNKKIRKRLIETQKRIKFVTFTLKKISKRFALHEKETLKAKAIWPIIRKYYNYSDLIIVPSERIKVELKRHDIKPPLEVVSNGIETNKFLPKSCYNKIPKFLYVGRLGYEKKIDVIIKSMSIVVKKYPFAVLSIVGDGPAMESLKKMVPQYHLNKNIKFFGFIQRENLSEIYLSHDVFVTASEMETQGMVLLESMASGLPVIGVNMLAIPDLVIDNYNGFLAKKGNYREIAEHICYFIEHYKKIPVFGKHARSVAEKHNLKTSIRHLEQVYSKTVRQFVSA